MNQEKAILHFNKFKNLRNARMKDMANGTIYTILKSRLEKITESDYQVLIEATNDLTGQTREFQSDYANSFFKEF